MWLIAWITSAALALSGCAMTGQVVHTALTPQLQIRSVMYTTMPCHGFCAVYTVTMTADGAGVFNGTSNTAVIGERRLTATPEQAAAFFDQIRPYLPTGELLLSGPDSCKMYASDLPSIDVRWTGDGGSGHLLYDQGCDREAHRLLADALRAAPHALPIAELIGKR